MSVLCAHQLKSHTHTHARRGARPHTHARAHEWIFSLGLVTMLLKTPFFLVHTTDQCVTWSEIRKTIHSRALLSSMFYCSCLSLFLVFFSLFVAMCSGCRVCFVFFSCNDSLCCSIISLHGGSCRPFLFLVASCNNPQPNRLIPGLYPFFLLTPRYISQADSD